MQNNNQDFQPKIFCAFVTVIRPAQQQVILDFLKTLPGLRLTYTTCDYAPLRIVRTGTPERFMEAE